jgi:cytochrome c oxidase cbb3-type subunit 3
VTEKNAELTSHNYDGIQEYDNPTPTWWTSIFLLTIGFSALYMFATLITGRQMSAEAFYEADYTESLKAQYGTLGELKPDADTLVKFAHDEKWVKVGGSIFQSNCVSCHGSDASGGAGPNLTDQTFVHIRTITDIADVITHGRANGAMPAWGQRLLPVEQVLVSSYVASLRGKNLPSAAGRPAEGQTIAPWPEPTK